MMMDLNMSRRHVVWHPGKVQKAQRQMLNRHKSCVLWFTGLSGSGKSTLANEVDLALYERGIHSYVLDGDNVRHGLNGDLGFSPEDRKENIRRIGEVSKLLVDAGVVTLTAFISPYLADREQVRAMFERGEFIEVYVKCDLAECERRDPKGLYKKARAGEIRYFTGIDDPYEVPVSPELVVENDRQSIEDSARQVLDYLREQGYLDVLSCEYQI